MTDVANNDEFLGFTCLRNMVPVEMRAELLSAMSHSDKIETILAKYRDVQPVYFPKFEHAFVKHINTDLVNHFVIDRLIATPDRIARLANQAVRYRNYELLHALLRHLVEQNAERQLAEVFHTACANGYTTAAALIIAALPKMCFTGETDRVEAKLIDFDIDAWICKAILFQMYDTALQFIERGADVADILHALLKSPGRPEDVAFLEYVLQNYDVDFGTDSVDWLSEQMCALYNRNVVEAFIRHFYYSNAELEVLLRSACLRLAADVVDMLLERGAQDVDNTLLEMSVQYRHRGMPDSFHAKHENYARVVNTVFRAGAQHVGYWFNLIRHVRIGKIPEMIETTRDIFMKHDVDEGIALSDILEHAASVGVDTDKLDFDTTVNAYTISTMMHAGLPRERVARLHKARSVLLKFDKLRDTARDELGKYIPADVLGLITGYLP